MKTFRRMLAITSVLAVLLSMMAAAVQAQTTTDGTLTNPEGFCEDYTQTFGFTSTDDKVFTVDGDAASTADGAFGVTVDTNCNHNPWTLNIASTDFTVDLGEFEGLFAAPTIPASTITMTPSGTVTTTYEERMLPSLFFAGVDPNDPDAVAALFASIVPVTSSSASDLSTQKAILASSFDNPAEATFGEGNVVSPVGFQGVTNASYTGSIADLPILVPSGTYEATFTLTFVSSEPEV